MSEHAVLANSYLTIFLLPAYQFVGRSQQANVEVKLSRVNRTKSYVNVSSKGHKNKDGTNTFFHSKAVGKTNSDMNSKDHTSAHQP